MGVSTQRLKMQLLILGLLFVSSTLSLVHYPNGAAVPYDGANLAATNAHLASKGYLGFPHHGLVNPFVFGRKKREADPLVHYPNGANIAATNAHLASKGYLGFPFIYGRKKREAEPLVHYPNGAAVPYDGANLAATNAHLL